MLKDYSYEELKSEEAAYLKKSFQSFKNSLEEMLFRSSIPSRKTDSLNIENERFELDLSYILDDCLGEFGLLENLVLLCKRNTLEFIGAANSHIKNKDLDQLGFAAHKIKAGLAMMKLKGLHSIVLQIEDCCRNHNDYKQLELLYERFLKEYPVIEKAIDLEMKKMKSSK